MADEKTCPHCGKPVPPTALGGICPECMLKAGLASQTEGPGGAGPKVVQPPPSPAEIAALFPQLEILECLGRGGMGVVYKARQPRLNRLVALKILARDKEQDGQFAERFTREAQTLARLNHPNIVTIHDFGQVGQASSLSPISSGEKTEGSKTGKMPVPLCYLVMEFVDGLNLRQLLLTGKMPPEQALAIVPKICEALQYAHEQGIVHRDIKPENILLDKQGRVKIADFGIAKMLGVETGHQTLTGAKDIMGTPHYMAPEQIEKPLTVDHRADIYSLGVVFYEMLTGELPLGKFQPPSSRMQGMQIDVRLDEVVLHALEKEPERRYQQASQVKTAVEMIAASAVKSEVLPQTGTKSEVESIRKQVKAPAIGLIITGALNWVLFALFSMVYGLKLAGSMGLAPRVDVPTVVLLIPFLAMAVNGFIIYAALKVMRLERWGAGITASVLAMIVAPANIIGLPLGIILLAVLFRREVREAFRANKAASAPAKIWPWLLGAAVTVGVIIIGLMIIVLASSSADATTNVTVTGTVTDAVTGNPIANARVDDNRYGASPRKAPQQTWTDANGNYELKTWYEEHTIAASAPGYEPGLNTLVTESFGSEREMQMDFKLRPTGTNAPALLSTHQPGPMTGRANGRNAYSTSPVTRGELSQAVTATGTLNPVSSDPGKWRIVSPVAEADIAMVEAGQNIVFTVDAFSNRRFTGRVLQISNAPTTIENTVAYETTLAVNDPEPRFRPGMTANVTIIVAHRDAVLRVPNVALRFRPPGSTSANRERGPERTVYVLPGGNESTPEPVRIKTGISDGSLTEVTEGLKEGDRVVTGLTSPQPAAQPAAKPIPARQP